MKVYVIMRNDFPVCIYEKKLDADLYVEDRNREQDVGRPEYQARDISWGVWEFEVIR